MKKINRMIANKRPYGTSIIILMVITIALFLLKNSIFDNQKDILDSPVINQANTTHPADHKPLPTAPSPTDSDLTSTTPEVPPETPAQAAAASCQKVSADLLLFYKHLDNQGYIKAYTDKEPIQKYLNRLITKLLDNPPVNEKETADLITVLKNAAHFFRVLGSKDLSLLRDIQNHEHPALEQRLASFYAWSTRGKECPDNPSLQLQLPLAKTYEYAAFFLNTMGGQSYLARRDSTLRILTRYYSVLILNQANQQSINKYNLNLSYHLQAVVKDIANSDFLENQASYLSTLKNIKVDH